MTSFSFYSSLFYFSDDISNNTRIIRIYFICLIIHTYFNVWYFIIRVWSSSELQNQLSQITPRSQFITKLSLKNGGLKMLLAPLLKILGGLSPCQPHVICAYVYGGNSRIFSRDRKATKEFVLQWRSGSEFHLIGAAKNLRPMAVLMYGITVGY